MVSISTEHQAGMQESRDAENGIFVPEYLKMREVGVMADLRLGINSAAALSSRSLNDHHCTHHGYHIPKSSQSFYITNDLTSWPADNIAPIRVPAICAWQYEESRPELTTRFVIANTLCDGNHCRHRDTLT